MAANIVFNIRKRKQTGVREFSLALFLKNILRLIFHEYSPYIIKRKGKCSKADQYRCNSPVEQICPDNGAPCVSEADDDGGNEENCLEPELKA